MPAFDFLYQLDELIADLDFFLAPEAPPPVRLLRPPPENPTPELLDARCGSEETRWLYTGFLLLQQLDGAASEYCFRRLGELNSGKWADSVNVGVNLAMAISLQGRHDEALALAGGAVEKFPDNVAVRKRHIMILEKADRPAELLRAVRAALALAPDDEELKEKLSNLNDSPET
jgi:anti-sigma factor ChrR (cupin superfamily)